MKTEYRNFILNLMNDFHKSIQIGFHCAYVRAILAPKWFISQVLINMTFKMVKFVRSMSTLITGKFTFKWPRHKGADFTMVNQFN